MGRPDDHRRRARGEVIAITSVIANLSAIFGGIIVFHDPIGSGPAGIAARFVAFASSSPARR